MGKVVIRRSRQLWADPHKEQSKDDAEELMTLMMREALAMILRNVAYMTRNGLLDDIFLALKDDGLWFRLKLDENKMDYMLSLSIEELMNEQSAKNAA